MTAQILSQLRAAVGPQGLVSTQDELRTYENDALTNFRVMPEAVVLPTSTEQVQEVLRICHREKIPFVARGSGTGLSGGALPVTGGIVISMARMKRILEVDYENQRVVVDPRPGVAGFLSAEIVNRSAADGYTWMMLTSQLMVATAVYPDVKFNLEKDFSSLSLIGTVSFVLVTNNDLPVKSLKDLLDYAKARPGRLSYGSVGHGTSFHLGMEQLKKLSGTTTMSLPCRTMSGARPFWISFTLSGI